MGRKIKRGLCQTPRTEGEVRKKPECQLCEDRGWYYVESGWRKWTETCECRIDEQHSQQEGRGDEWMTT